jgi:drug/metabolite transporter (DMT)-like permease
MVAPIPLITILVSIPLLGELPTPRQLLGVLGGLACVWLIVDDGFDRGMSLTFVALALLIPLMSATCNTVIKWKLGSVPAVPMTAAILMIAGLSLAPLEFSPAAIDALHMTDPTAQATPMTWVYLLILGVVGTGLSTAVFVWMILERGPLFAGMTTYVVPVLSLLWGTLDHERITPQQMLAIGGVLAMVALVQTGSSRETVVAEPAADLLSLPLAEEAFAAEPESQVA